MNEYRDMYLQLYYEWFQNKSFWFEKNPETDIYLSNKYFPLVENKFDTNIDLTKEEISVQIGIILAYDQIPRHHNRIHPIDVNKYSEVAANTTSCLIQYIVSDKEFFHEITANEWCFIMLPYRHLHNLRKIYKLIVFFIEKHNCNHSSLTDKGIYKRFLRNTLTKVHKVISSKTINSQKEKDITSIINCYNQWSEFESILCFNPMCPIILKSDSQRMSDVFQEELKYLPEKCNILVSISGGVDSMVCLLLTKLCAPGKNVTCVHINYNNRQECSLETEFINKFCSILNTKFYYRKIKEISREKCHGSGLRELYEDVTKQIRFDMYKQVMLSEGYDTTNTYVVMGHNADDCFENIITNINNKHSYNNLHGMERISQIDDINFFRPLLKIRKSDIIEFAHSNNIPYLKDSTPKWSMRGKIRDNILPVMESINKNTIESYFHLCDHLHRSDKLIKNYIIPNVLKSFYNEQNTIVGYFDQPELSQLINEHDVWKTIFLSDKFESVFQKRNSSFKSIKEFSNFLMRYLSVNNKGRCKFVLRKDINVTLEQKDNKLKISFIKND